MIFSQYREKMKFVWRERKEGLGVDGELGLYELDTDNLDKRIGDFVKVNLQSNFCGHLNVFIVFEEIRNKIQTLVYPYSRCGLSETEYEEHIKEILDDTLVDCMTCHRRKIEGRDISASYYLF